MTDPDASQHPPETRTRFRLVAVLVGLLLTAAALATLLQARRALTERTLLWLLDVNHAQNVSLHVEAVDPGRLVLSQLNLSYTPAPSTGLDLTVARAEFRFNPWDLLEGRVDQIDLSGLQLRANLDTPPEPPVTDPRAGPLDSSNSSPNQWLASLPTRHLRVQAARAEIEFPEGRLAAQIDLEMSPLSDRSAQRGSTQARLKVRMEPDDVTVPSVRLRTPVELSLEVDLLGSELMARLGPMQLDADLGEGDATRVTFQTPGFHAHLISGSAPEQQLTLDAGAQTLQFPSLGISAHGITLAAAIDPTEPAASLTLEAAQIRDRRSPLRFEPLSVRAQLELGGERAPFELEVSDESAQLAVHVKGHHDPTRGRGSAEIRLAPLHFDEQALQPAHLAPVLESIVSDVRGSVQALGSASWDLSRPDPLTADLQVAMQDLGLSTPLARLEGIHGVIEFQGPSPWSTPPGQQIAIGVVDLGLAATDALIVFGLRPDGVVVVGDAQLGFAGGILHSGGRIDLDADVQELVLEVSDVDLGRLLTLVDLEGLAGSGTLSGRIPLRVKDGHAEIHNGQLSNLGSGWIRYRPPEAGGIAASAHSQLGTALGALSNLQFEQLGLSLSGDTRGVMRCVLRVEGQNPDFEGGWPVRFKLDLESRLVDLVREVSSAAGIAQTVQERISDFSARAANFAPAPTSTAGDAVVDPEPRGD